MEIRVTVCNVCKDRTKVTRSYEVDLCEDDAAGLGVLPAPVPRSARKAAAKKAVAPRRRGRTTSIEEIERGKRAGTI